MAQLSCDNCLEVLVSDNQVLTYHYGKGWLLCQDCQSNWSEAELDLIRPLAIMSQEEAQSDQVPAYHSQLNQLKLDLVTARTKLDQFFTKVLFLAQTNQLINLLALAPDCYYRSSHKELDLVNTQLDLASNLLSRQCYLDLTNLTVPKLNLRLKRGRDKFYLDTNAFAELFLYQLDPKNVSWSNLIRNPNLTMEDVSQFLDSDRPGRVIRSLWHWTAFVGNPNFDLAFYQAQTEPVPADFGIVGEIAITAQLCRNNTLNQISPNMIHPGWAAELSSNHYLTVEFVLQRPDIAWSVEILVNNPALPLADLVKYQTQLRQQLGLDWSQIRLTRTDLTWGQLARDYPEVAEQVKVKTKQLHSANLVLTNYVTISDLLTQPQLRWNFYSLLDGLTWDLSEVDMLIAYIKLGGDFDRNPSLFKNLLPLNTDATWSDWLWYSLSRCRQSGILDLVLKHCLEPWDYFHGLVYHPKITQQFYLQLRAKVLAQGGLEPKWRLSVLTWNSNILREHLYTRPDQDVIKREQGWFASLNGNNSALTTADLVNFRELGWDWCQLSGASLGIE